MQTLYGTCNSTLYGLNCWCRSFRMTSFWYFVQLPDRTPILSKGVLFTYGTLKLFWNLRHSRRFSHTKRPPTSRKWDVGGLFRQLACPYRSHRLSLRVCRLEILSKSSSLQTPLVQRFFARCPYTVAPSAARSSCKSVTMSPLDAIGDTLKGIPDAETG